MNRRTPLTRRIKLTDEKGNKQIETNAIVDTGSAVSLIIFSLVANFEITCDGTLPSLRGAFDGNSNEVVGKTVLYLLLDGIRQPIEFLVMSHAQVDCIIGWPTIQNLGLSLSVKGIFTKEKRIFGKTIAESVKLVNVVSQNESIKVYNINVSEDREWSAVNLGDGIFEEASSGFVYTSSNKKPSITHSNRDKC